MFHYDRCQLENCNRALSLALLESKTLDSIGVRAVHIDGEDRLIHTNNEERTARIEAAAWVLVNAVRNATERGRPNPEGRS